MKGGKDDDKVVEPMFPRLHVNDTEKGGPRAPPRNKMALYEQLTIPSHRYNPGVVHLKTHTNNKRVPIASMGQGTGQVKYFPQSKPSSASSRAADELKFQYSGVVNMSVPAAGDEQRKKLVDEDDFMVPILSQSEMDKFSGKAPIYGNLDGNKQIPVSSSHLMRLQSKFNNKASKIDIEGCNSKQEMRKEGGKWSREFELNTDQGMKSTQPSKDMVKGPSRPDCVKTQEGQKNDKLNRSGDANVCLDHEAELPDIATACGDSVPSNGIEKNSTSMMGYSTRQMDGKPSDDVNGRHCRDVMHVTWQRENTDKGEDSSQTSRVESTSGTGISPDDIVGLLGLKHFWNARRAIVNQQRLFAVQLFELHRLIKVQRLMARSTDLLLESSTVGKSASGSVVKPIAQSNEQSDHARKLHQRIEGTAENIVVQPPVSSLQNPTQRLTNSPFSGSTASAVVTTDTKMMSWCFPQHTGHQWLVPVMSPSEGLVYKPYIGPSFMDPLCGGCGHGPPMVGNFLSPAYNFPTHFQEGIRGPGAVPYHGPCYFPPYGMPMMSPVVLGSSVDQMNQVSGSNTMALMAQHQISSNTPNKKDGAVSSGIQMPISKDSERQGSTASSPGEKAQSMVMGSVHTGGDGVALFPVSPFSRGSEGSSQPHEPDQPSRVIRVVPHNWRSATESAIRILHSIQEERKQHE